MLPTVSSVAFFEHDRLPEVLCSTSIHDVVKLLSEVIHVNLSKLNV